jgi:hypothetical protein
MWNTPKKIAPTPPPIGHGAMYQPAAPAANHDPCLEQIWECIDEAHEARLQGDTMGEQYWVDLADRLAQANFGTSIAYLPAMPIGWVAPKKRVAAAPPLSAWGSYAPPPDSKRIYGKWTVGNDGGMRQLASCECYETPGDPRHWVNVGFMNVIMACKKCGRDQT